MRLGIYLTSLTRTELELLLNELNLTEEEEQIYKYLSKGRSKVYIADHCQCSIGTVSNRIAHINSKVERMKGGV